MSFGRVFIGHPRRAAAAAPFRPTETAQTPRRRQGGQTDVVANLLLTLLAAAPAAAPFFADGDMPSQVERRPQVQVDSQPANMVLISQAQDTVMLRGASYGFLPERREDQQADAQSAPYALIAQAPAAAPFTPADLPQPDRRTDQTVDLAGSGPLIAQASRPFIPGEGPQVARKVDQTVEVTPAPYALSAILAAPFPQSEFPDEIPRIPDQVVEQPPQPVALVTLPFFAHEFPAELPRLADQVVEQIPAPYALRAILAAPFVPLELPQATVERKPETQDAYQRSLDLVAMPFPAVDTTDATAQIPDQSFDAQPAPYGLYRILAAPFPAAEPVDPVRPQDQVVDQGRQPIALTTAPIIPLYPVDTTPDPVPLPDQIVEYQRNTLFLEFQPPPYRPVDTTVMPERPEDQAAEISPAIRAAPQAAPFIPGNIPDVDARRENQQVEAQSAPYALYGVLAQPFRPVDTGQVELRFGLEGSDVLQSIALYVRPFRPALWVEPERPRDQDADVVSNLPISAVRPVVPVNETPVERRRAPSVDDVPNLTLTLIAPAPFYPVDGWTPERRRELVVDEIAIALTFVAPDPFIPVDGDMPERRPNQPIDISVNQVTTLYNPFPFPAVDYQYVERRPWWTPEPGTRSYILYGIPSGFVEHDDCRVWIADAIALSWTADPVGLSWTADAVLVSWVAEPCDTSWVADPPAHSWVAEPVVTSWTADPCQSDG